MPLFVPAVAVPVADTTALVYGSTDPTKKVRLEVDGLTTGVTRVVTVPDGDVTLAGINRAQTWTADQTFANIFGTKLFIGSVGILPDDPNGQIQLLVRSDISGDPGYAAGIWIDSVLTTVEASDNTVAAPIFLDHRTNANHNLAEILGIDFSDYSAVASGVTVARAAFDGFYGHTTGTGTITNLQHVEIYDEFTGVTVTTGRALRLRTPVVSGGATLTSWTGIVIENLSGLSSTTKNAINYGTGKFVVDSDGVLAIARVGIGTTSTDGALLRNTTAAAVGAQQQSPRLHFSGFGWKTNATAASQAVDHIVELLPVQAAAAPEARLEFKESINGGAYTTYASFSRSESSGNILGRLRLGSGNTGLWSTGGADLILSKAGAQVIVVNAGIGMYSGDTVRWANTIDMGGQLGSQTFDVLLTREAAGTLVQRNATNPQTFRIYGSFTDTSNYVRGSVAMSTSQFTIAAETAGTGADDLDIALTPAGVGLLKFGSHSALAGETVTGYITIKDSAGTSRKLAVVS